MCPYLLISINELLISIIPFIDINKYGLNVKTAAHRYLQFNWRYLQIDIFGDIYNSFGDICKSIADICNSVNKCENGTPYICGVGTLVRLCSNGPHGNEPPNCLTSSMASYVNYCRKYCYLIIGLLEKRACHTSKMVAALVIYAWTTQRPSAQFLDRRRRIGGLKHPIIYIWPSSNIVVN